MSLNQVTRRALALLARLTVPPYISGCMRCGMPWTRTQHHDTPYSEGGGCFPLCQWCWERLTPEGRLPYYERLIDDWQFVNAIPSEREGHNGQPWPELRATLRQNVLAGL